jgi:hypothetical protein
MGKKGQPTPPPNENFLAQVKEKPFFLLPLLFFVSFVHILPSFFSFIL